MRPHFYHCYCTVEEEDVRMLRMQMRAAQLLLCWRGVHLIGCLGGSCWGTCQGGRHSWSGVSMA
eukprot:1138316-Pelagomonas_calceolata.AAC.7